MSYKFLAFKIFFLRFVRRVSQWKERVTAFFLSSTKLSGLLLISYLIIIFLWLFLDLYLVKSNEEILRRLKRFPDEWGVYIGIYIFVVSLLTFISSSFNKKHEEAQRLRQSQKERIKLLDDFGPTPKMATFFDDRSIYSAIISSLHRLERKVSSEKTEYAVCMLLCSPALDYHENPGSVDPNHRDQGFQWGLEFRNIVKSLSAKPNVKFEICHLPIGSQSGLNIMEDFIAILANYNSENTDEFNSEFNKLKERTKIVNDDFKRWATDFDDKNRFILRTHTINIPFQIILVNGQDLTEVIVAFAGREILENQKGEDPSIKGFFSSDPWVVKTFHKIFRDYTELHRREPFVPVHTRNIIQQHKSTGAHSLENYYFGMIPKLEVMQGVFSPAFGNASKFITWAIDKILTTPSGCCTKVLDIGSGTGVLALTAYNVMKNANVEQPIVVALEPDPGAFQNLKKNIEENCEGEIDVRQWELKGVWKNNGKQAKELIDSFFVDSTDTRVQLEEKYQVIISDLPFVDADNLNGDRRFLDLHHKSHQVLFKLISGDGVLEKNGILLTTFSSLGGPEDIQVFENLIRDSGLQVIQRVDFFEEEYMWMVYIIMRKADFDSNQQRFWWKRLQVNNYKKDTEETHQ